MVGCGPFGTNSLRQTPVENIKEQEKMWNLGQKTLLFFSLFSPSRSRSHPLPHWGIARIPRLISPPPSLSSSSFSLRDFFFSFLFFRGNVSRGGGETSSFSFPVCGDIYSFLRLLLFLVLFFFFRKEFRISRACQVQISQAAKYNTSSRKREKEKEIKLAGPCRASNKSADVT